MSKVAVILDSATGHGTSMASRVAAAAAAGAEVRAVIFGNLGAAPCESL